MNLRELHDLNAHIRRELEHMSSDAAATDSKTPGQHHILGRG